MVRGNDRLQLRLRNLKDLALYVEAVEKRDPRHAAPRIADYRESRGGRELRRGVEELSDDRAWGRQPQHLARAAEGIALREGQRRANARKAAGTRPDDNALGRGFERELCDPVSVAPADGGPFDVQRGHISPYDATRA